MRPLLYFQISIAIRLYNNVVICYSYINFSYWCKIFLFLILLHKKMEIDYPICWYEIFLQQLTNMDRIKYRHLGGLKLLSLIEFNLAFKKCMIWILSWGAVGLYIMYMHVIDGKWATRRYMETTTHTINLIKGSNQINWSRTLRMYLTNR